MLGCLNFGPQVCAHLPESLAAGPSHLGMRVCQPLHVKSELNACWSARSQVPWLQVCWPLQVRSGLNAVLVCLRCTTSSLA